MTGSRLHRPRRRGGRKALVDGRFESDNGGFFLGPTILDDVRPDMKVAQEEIFGPVLSLERLDSLDDALEVIRKNQFGGATAIFTRSGGVAREFRRRVTAGMVGINIPVPAAMAFFPFAGWKGSFYGDLHATGMDGVHFFTESKVVTTRWPSRDREEIRAADRAHVLHSWSVQSELDPVAVADGAGQSFLGLRRQELPRLRLPVGQPERRAPAPPSRGRDQGAAERLCTISPKFANDARR